ncbi:hypothetical protein BH10BAC1_BH10BAC1_19150 [soil metagenome]
MILNHSIKKPINEVYNSIADVELFVKFHPVVYKAEKIGENEYVFYEKIKLLFIPIPIKYKVILLELNPNKSIKMFSEVQKGVYLNLKFSFIPTPEGTGVVEEVEVKASFLVKLVFQMILKRVHKNWFKNIAN